MAPAIGDAIEELLEEIERLRSRPPVNKKTTSRDTKEKVVYLLRRSFEIPGSFGQADIIAVSTNKKMIFSKGNLLAKDEFYKSKKLGKWDYAVLIFDNESGKLLDKVDIPHFHE